MFWINIIIIIIIIVQRMLEIYQTRAEPVSEREVCHVQLQDFYFFCLP